jgi:UDP-GlcNAc:undecaprenyl-phosphate GlcNAc-1-phosphate transferase
VNLVLSIYTIGFVAACLIALLLTPIIKKLAFLIGAIDEPDYRKVHVRVMPRLGGLAIYISFVSAYLIISPAVEPSFAKPVLGLLIGSFVIVITGIIDDIFQLSPKWKLLGQLIASGIVIYFGLTIDLVNIPFGQSNISIGWLSIPLTVIWIIGVTNSINLIDGLDGLSAGVSAIATLTILVIALMMPNVTVVLLSIILLGSLIGFLFFNFHPAKIFMGDSGSLFLGFTLATLSIMGFKQAAVVSLLIPVMILGVPLSDTFFAIMRRFLNKVPISKPDKNHLHHCLLQLGYSHRKTVLIIYGISLIFGTSAVLSSKLMSQNILWGWILIVIALFASLTLGAEMIGIISKQRKPITRFILKITGKNVESNKISK